MTKYAKMEDVINALCTCECEDKKECIDYMLISNVPTIDIVHCSECKYWEKEYGVLNPISTAPGYATIEVINYCTKRMLSYDANYFCADGERKK